MTTRRSTYRVIALDDVADFKARALALEWAAYKIEGAQAQGYVLGYLAPYSQNPWYATLHRSTSLPLLVTMVLV